MRRIYTSVLLISSWMVASCVTMYPGFDGAASGTELQGSEAEAREFLRIVVQWERCELIETPDSLVARHTNFLGWGHEDVTVRLESSQDGTVIVLFESADQWDLVEALADRCMEGQKFVRAGMPVPD